MDRRKLVKPFSTEIPPSVCDGYCKVQVRSTEYILLVLCPEYFLHQPLTVKPCWSEDAARTKTPKENSATADDDLRFIANAIAWLPLLNVKAQPRPDRSWCHGSRMITANSSSHSTRYVHDQDLTRMYRVLHKVLRARERSQ